MHLTFVHVWIHPEQRSAFVAATLANRAGTRTEPGNLRFDVLADAKQADHFVLLEAFRDEAAALAHKTSAHYLRWREVVAPMMAKPREGVAMQAIAPDDPQAWIETSL